MELKLNIYDKKSIVKTYTCDTYELMFGTVEDFLDLIDTTNLKSDKDVEIVNLVSKACVNGMGTIKVLLKDIFEGLTDNELKNTKVSEIASVLVDIVKYSVLEITKGNQGKN